jgi:hypothetical protein
MLKPALSKRSLKLNVAVAVILATLSLTSVQGVSAQEIRTFRENRQERRQEWREARRDRRQDWRETRRDHRQDWRETRRDRRQDFWEARRFQ